MAAEGNTELVGADNETYGWSPAYEAVAALRERLETIKRVSTARALEAEKLRERLGVAKGLLQEARDAEVVELRASKAWEFEVDAFLAERGAEEPVDRVWEIYGAQGGSMQTKKEWNAKHDAAQAERGAEEAGDG